MESQPNHLKDIIRITQQAMQILWTSSSIPNSSTFAVAVAGAAARADGDADDERLMATMVYPSLEEASS